MTVFMVSTIEAVSPANTRRHSLVSTATSASSATTATAARRKRGKCLKLGWYHLLGAIQDLDQLASQTSILIRHKKGHRQTLLPGTSRSTNAVNVTLHFLWKVKIDNDADIIYIKTTSSHCSREKKENCQNGECLKLILTENLRPRTVCGDQQSAPHTLEFPQDAVSFLLRFVAMHGTGLKAIDTERSGEHVATLLRLDEDQHAVLGTPVLPQDAYEVVVLVKVAANFDLLRDIQIGRQVKGANSNLVVRAQVVVGESLHFLWPGSAPHEDLAIGSNLGHDLSNLRFKPHVQHAVRFVHDKVRHTSKVRVALFEMIDQASRRGNDDFATVLKVAYLRVLLHCKRKFHETRHE